MRVSRVVGWLLVVLAVAGLAALYGDALRAPLLNDDFLFLEEARTRPLAESLTGLGALGNYYRPVSRQLYFETVDRVAGGRAAAFHAVSFVLFLAALALLADALLALVPLPGVVAGVLWFALLPFQRVNLMWVSCSQDLLALTGALAAFALYRRGRWAPALACYAAAIASKESAWPLPLALIAWDVIVRKRPARDAIRSAAPFALLLVAWGAVVLVMRARHAARAPLAFDPTNFVAGYAHMLQSLVGLEHLPGGLASFQHSGPALVPLVILGAAAFGLTRAGAGHSHGAPPPAPVAPRDAVRFGLAWLLAFGAMIGPVVSSWSAYFYTLAGAGGAVLVGVLFGRARPAAVATLVAASLWIHAAASATPAFSVTERPWTWTSHLTSFYFERAARLTSTLSQELLRAEPSPPREARLYFSNLPSFAGFQMGNGALVRTLYRRPDLETHFYTQFSESTAAGYPARFFYWNGDSLEALYADVAAPFFQVGGDLVLLGRLDGASHAFRRGLAAGERRNDLLYWLGWTELWRGRRVAGETAWKELGFRDDSLLRMNHLRVAHDALVDGDTLAARRHLLSSIQYGVGYPEAHAILGELLLRVYLKYGLLELEVATRLNPNDWVARRAMLQGLLEARLDEQARRTLEVLDRTYADTDRDSIVVAARRELARRSGSDGDVVDYRAAKP